MLKKEMNKIFITTEVKNKMESIPLNHFQSEFKRILYNDTDLIHILLTDKINNQNGVFSHRYYFDEDTYNRLEERSVSLRVPRSRIFSSIVNHIYKYK